MSEAAPAGQPTLIPSAEPEPFFTIITTDGRPLRFYAEGRGTVRIVPPGRRAQPWRIDRYQAGALIQALSDAAASADPTYLFESRIGRGAA